jgi:ribose 5-phosphate isomerase B
MMIALGNDHTGYALKKAIMEYLDKRGIEYKDFGCGDVTKSDYPEFAKAVGRAIQNKECDKGILICGTGIGISIAANKMKGIRAALCHDCFSAEATRLHNDANVLAMGARVIGVGHALKIVETFLNTPFSGEERHLRRIQMLEDDDCSSK